MSASKKSDEVNFEQGLEKLESIIEQMESGELSLNDLIAKYEAGSQYLALCQQKLKDAEKRIEILRNKDPEDPKTEDFE